MRLLKPPRCCLVWEMTAGCFHRLFDSQGQQKMEQREGLMESQAEGSEGRLRELTTKWFIDTQLPLIVHDGFFPKWFQGFITRKWVSFDIECWSLSLLRVFSLSFNFVGDISKGMLKKYSVKRRRAASWFVSVIKPSLIFCLISKYLTFFFPDSKQGYRNMTHKLDSLYYDN